MCLIKSYVEVVVMRAQVHSEAREPPDNKNMISRLPDTDEEEEIARHKRDVAQRQMRAKIFEVASDSDADDQSSKRMSIRSSDCPLPSTI